MAKVGILSVGKLKTAYYKQACEDYAKRIKRYAMFEDIVVKEELVAKNASDKDRLNAQQKEGERLAEQAAKYDSYYCLDGKGKKLSSEDFAKMLQKQFGAGKNSIAFLIGGSNGLSDAVKQKANGVISFSDMTFAHHLFKVMLSEQIYRAFTILNNEKYHK